MSFNGTPEDVDEVCIILQSFKRFTSRLSSVTGCVGATIGITTNIEKPRPVRNPSSYYCTKGFYEYSLQSICHGPNHFLWFSCLSLCSSHVLLAPAISKVDDWRLKECSIPAELWTAGDEGYACRDKIVV